MARVIQMSDQGRDYSGEIRNLQSEINQLERRVSRVEGQVDQLWSELRSEIARLEREMREIGEMIVQAIDRQTIAVVGGVAATTLMIERTKDQLESDFIETRNTLDLQTESNLQIEIGKKIAEIQSTKSKLDVFGTDIKSRFDKSIEGVALNRELYNVHFRKIHEEYDNKIRTIGEHIFQIKEEDIAPAVESTKVVYEAAHHLPIEMDMQRLAARAENLDETLSILRSSRLEEVLTSVERVDATLAAFNFPDLELGDSVNIGVLGLATMSSVGSRLCLGLTALTPSESEPIRLTVSDPSLAPYTSDRAVQVASEALSGAAAKGRAASVDELMAFGGATSRLHEKGLISSDLKRLIEEFLESGNLEVIGE